MKLNINISFRWDGFFVNSNNIEKFIDSSIQKYVMVCASASSIHGTEPNIWIESPFACFHSRTIVSTELLDIPGIFFQMIMNETHAKMFRWIQICVKMYAASIIFVYQGHISVVAVTEYASQLHTNVALSLWWACTKKTIAFDGFDLILIRISNSIFESFSSKTSVHFIFIAKFL